MGHGKFFYFLIQRWLVILTRKRDRQWLACVKGNGDLARRVIALSLADRLVSSSMSLPRLGSDNKVSSIMVHAVCWY